MDLSIVIINYNAEAVTRNCIESIINHTHNIDYEIILVDNASKEFNSASFEILGNRIKIIKSKENIGFAGGNNLGILSATGQYVLLLNNDTLLKDNCIEKAFGCLKNSTSPYVLTIKLVFPDGKHQCSVQRFPRIDLKFLELFRLQKLFSRKKAGKLLLGYFFDYSSNIEVDWAWGAFLLIPRKLIDELGGRLDQSYFMYYEDIQWALDFRKVGYKIYFYSEAEIIHLLGTSKGQNEKWRNESRLLFYKRNYNWISRKLISLLDMFLSIGLKKSY